MGPILKSPPLRGKAPGFVISIPGWNGVMGTGLNRPGVRGEGFSQLLVSFMFFRIMGSCGGGGGGGR